ncbi:universal stress protein [Lichenihabitans psoromatis]|uniref:universal stress protein n=1 Tax=Lichenihabitans psoromatis TaxID=2528642 RepID=UPI001038461A|nr:universal stress protein [Lichenihabitans psoromatis]
MKNVLVLVEDHSCIDSVLATAVLVGQTFDSYLEGVPIAPDISDIVVADISIGATVFDARTRQVLTDRAARHFTAAMDHAGYPRDTRNNGPVAVWTNKMTNDGVVGCTSRVYDLVVLGKPGSAGHDPRQATFESVLFESGRPVLIAPPTIPKRLGDTVLIAWNRSSETARTVASAMPFLRRAKRVVILTLEVSNVPGPSGTLLAAALERDGIETETLKADSKSGNEGPGILSKAVEIGADLIIKGGYTQSRLRQMIFGGATSHILAHSDIPVFMAH